MSTTANATQQTSQQDLQQGRQRRWHSGEAAATCVGMTPGSSWPLGNLPKLVLMAKLCAVHTLSGPRPLAANFPKAMWTRGDGPRRPEKMDREGAPEGRPGRELGELGLRSYAAARERRRQWRPGDGLFISWALLGCLLTCTVCVAHTQVVLT